MRDACIGDSAGKVAGMGDCGVCKCGGVCSGLHTCERSLSEDHQSGWMQVQGRMGQAGQSGAIWVLLGGVYREAGRLDFQGVTFMGS